MNTINSEIFAKKRYNVKRKANPGKFAYRRAMVEKLYMFKAIRSI